MKGKLSLALKLAAAAIAALVAADLLLPVVIRAILPPQRLRALIVTEARKSLRRDVRLEGVSYSLLKGLTLENLAVSESPDFKAGTFASVRSFHVQVRWLPLLRRKVIIDSVAAEGLKVTVIALRGGTYNFSGIAASTAPAAAGGPSAAPSGSASNLLTFGIRKTRIEDGEFTYKDAVSGDSWRLRQIEAAVGRFRLQGPFDAELSLKGSARSAGQPVEVGLAYEGVIDLGGQDPRRTTVAVKKLSVDYGGLRVLASGKAANFSAPSVDLTFSAFAQSIPLLEGVFAGFMTPLSADFGLRGQVKAKTSGFPGAALAAYGMSPTLVVPSLNIGGQFVYGGDKIALKGVRLDGAAGDIDVSGVIDKLSSAAIDPHLEVKAKLDLPALKASDIPVKSLPAGLTIPPTKWDVDASVALDEVKVRRLRLIAGHTDLEIVQGGAAGLRGKQASLKVPLNCRSFDLGELSQFSDDARQMGLTGKGLFTIEVSGKWAKPALTGQLKVSGLGGIFEGLELSGVAGTADFDAKHISVQNLTGKVGDGNLKLSLTVDNYTGNPAIGLDADLDEFDLGKYLAAKAAVVSKPTPPAASSPAAQAPAAPISTTGTLLVGHLIHPNADAKKVRLSWDLEGITPDMRQLTGSALFKVSGGGSFSDLGGASKGSKILKVLFFPFIILQKIGSIGGIHLFPDMNNIRFSEMTGDYLFTNGLMTLRDSHLDTDAGKISALGSINLPQELLDLAVTAHIAHVAPLEIDVKGTFDKPVTHVDLGKLLLSPATGILDLLK